MILPGHFQRIWKVRNMKKVFQAAAMAAALSLTVSVAQAGKYQDTVALFHEAPESASFFKHAYGYAVFPTVGEAGFIVGGALGHGRVYAHGKLIGDTTMTEVSAGFQAGGKAFSQIIFFRDKSALEAFESGNFQFEAGASAVAITAGVSASAATNGAQSSASLTDHDASNAGAWSNGMAVFSVAKGGLMYAATLAGQHFSYKDRGA
jgi:lipid-binding SYLF domain-containing protein